MIFKSFGTLNSIQKIKKKGSGTRKKEKKKKTEMKRKKKNKKREIKKKKKRCGETEGGCVFICWLLCSMHRYWGFHSYFILAS